MLPDYTVASTDAIVKLLNHLDADALKKACVMHARIGTSGSDQVLREIGATAVKLMVSDIKATEKSDENNEIVG